MEEISINKYPSKTGIETIEVNGYLLHSKYNPIKEAQKIVTDEYKENYLHIFFGYGLGYIVNEFVEYSNFQEDYLVIDPFKEVLAPDNEEVLNFDIQLFKKILFRKLEHKKSEVKVICSPNYNKIAENQYLELLKVVKDTQILERLNSNTLKTFALPWQENYIKNMVFSCEDVQFKDVEGKFNSPVVIASGGPSLTKQLSLLKQYKDKIIIIAAGSTINSLLKAEIEPDFVVSVDGGEANYLHFKDIKDINTTLIYSLSSHYKIQQNYCSKKIPFLLNDDDYINNILNKCGFELPFLNGGTSVANYAFEIAKHITAGPIALIGQDLAYTNNMTHAENNKHSAQIDEKFVKDHLLFEIEGYYGEQVLTDYKFFEMKNRFEELIKISNHSSPIFNCTEGGVKINEFEQRSFVEFLGEFANESKKKIVLSESNQNGKIEKLYKIFKEKINRLLILEKELKGTLILIKKEKNLKYFSNNLLVKLEKMDKKIEEFFKEESFNHILQPIIAETMSSYKPKSFETDEEKFNRVYTQTENLYTELLFALEHLRKYFKEALEMKKGD